MVGSFNYADASCFGHSLDAAIQGCLLEYVYGRLDHTLNLNVRWPPILRFYQELVVFIAHQHINGASSLRDERLGLNIVGSTFHTFLVRGPAILVAGF